MRALWTVKLNAKYTERKLHVFNWSSEHTFQVPLFKLNCDPELPPFLVAFVQELGKVL